MAKRIVIEVSENPAFLPEQLADFIKEITFVVETWLGIHEYTMKVEK